MKNHHTPITKLATIAVATLISTGAASSATTHGKGGMQTTTSHTQTGFVGDGLPMLAPGVQELGLSGRLNWDDDTLYNFNISYGRFLTSNWLVGARAGVSGVNSNKDYNIGVFGEYNFLTGTKWVPFIGADLGYKRPYEGSNSGILGAYGGVKYFMRSNLAIFASTGGGWVISGSGNSGFDKEINLGLRFYF